MNQITIRGDLDLYECLELDAMYNFKGRAGIIDDCFEIDVKRTHIYLVEV